MRFHSYKLNMKHENKELNFCPLTYNGEVTIAINPAFAGVLRHPRLAGEGR